MLSKEDTKMQIAKKIEWAMKEKGLTKSQFAKIMNVQPCIITRWLKGNHNFQIKTLFDIENALSIQLIKVQ